MSLKNLQLALPALALVSTTAQAQFQTATNLPTGQQPDHVAVGDLNGDGAADIAITTDAPDKVSIHFNAGGGAFGGPVSVFLPGGSSPAAICACDVDGDSDLDLAVTLKNINAAVVLTNNGTGTFTMGPTVAVGTEPSHLAAADVDGDMDLDLVTSNRDSNNLTVLLNNGAGGFTAGGTLAVGAEPRAVVAADLTGDGLADLAVSIHDDRRIDVLTNLGGGTFGAPVGYSVGAQLRPDGLGAADLDGDGDAELIAATSGNGLNFVSVFTNAGGVFSGPFNTATGGVDPAAVITGDFDLDGDADVACTNQSSASLSVFTNTGGALGAATIYAVGTTPEQVAGGDLDGNGSMDLVTANRDSNSASVLLNQNAGNNNPTSFCVTSPNSFGAGALIGNTGSVSIAANDFVLTVSGAVPGGSGLFFYGDQQVQFPFWDGVRCVDGNVTRFDPTVVGGDGSAMTAVDFTMPPQASGTILAGSTWYFQFWFRDVPAGGTGANLSDGLAATFTP